MNSEPKAVETETLSELESRHAAARAGVFERWRRRGIEVLPGQTAEEAIRQHGPDGCVEHEIDAEPEESLLPDPYWRELGERGEGAKALFDAGLKKKAFRYVDCEMRGEKTECSRYPAHHRFFKRYHCMNRFCSKCGKVHRARLYSHYSPVLAAFLNDCPSLPFHTLARVNFTMRCDGVVPTREQVRAFNQAVRKTIRKAVRVVLKERAKAGDEWARSAFKSRKVVYGILFSDEVGFESRGHVPDAKRKAHGLNLHAHGVFYGPFLQDWKQGWEIFRNTWREVSARAFGEQSHGCWIKHLTGWRAKPDRSIRHALNHLLKYISKCPYETMQRMADLESAFDHTRRVHAGGLWHGLKEPEHRHFSSGTCPICQKAGRESALYMHRQHLPNGGELPEFWPISVLREQGYMDLEEVRARLGTNPYERRGP